MSRIAAREGRNLVQPSPLTKQDAIARDQLRSAGPTTWRRAAATGFGLCVIVLSVSIVLLHLSLLPLGQWHDEFGTFAWYRSDSTLALLTRLVTWSPRPVSEAAIFLYAMACDRLHSPLFVEALSLSWLTFLLPSIFVLLREVRARTDWSSFLAKVSIAAALPAMCLLSVDLPDTFLWPMSAFAYLPAIGSDFSILFVLLYCRPQTRRSWLLLSAFGVFGTCCVEMSGMVAGVLFSALLVWSAQNEAPSEQKPALRFRLACCLPPILAAAATGILILTHRARQGSPLTADNLLVHRPLASIASAVPIFFRSLVGQPASIYRLEPAHVMANFLDRIAWFAGTFMLGNHLIGRDRTTKRAMLGLLGISIVMACFISVAMTLYQFGIMCCERHDTTRTCLEYVALTCFGLWLASTVENTRFSAFIAPSRAIAGPALLLVALIIPSPRRLAGLAAVYGQSSDLRSATAATWQSGWRRSSQSMRFYIVPQNVLIGRGRDELGTHTRPHETSAQVRDMMSYFAKQQIVFDHLQAVP